VRRPGAPIGNAAATVYVPPAPSSRKRATRQESPEYDFDQMEGDGGEEDEEEDGDFYEDDEEDVGRKRKAPAKRGAGSSRVLGPSPRR
jgi:hypothetical protein